MKHTLTGEIDIPQAAFDGLADRLAAHDRNRETARRLQDEAVDLSQLVVAMEFAGYAETNWIRASYFAKGAASALGVDDLMLMRAVDRSAGAS